MVEEIQKELCGRMGGGRIDPPNLRLYT